MGAFREFLEAGDFKALRRAWSDVAPGMPQPDSDEAAEVTMHMARTAAESIKFRYRAYSHAWLSERGLPSQLPDHLRASAERAYPRIVEAVGVSVNFTSPWMEPAAVEVTGAMNHAILECYEDKRTEPAFVSERMREAKERTMRALFGPR